ncbi:hypothetical protein MKW94_006908 [Papaver nudicaule]|uniref:Membrane-associated kinase regulator 2 n=1 Tax=Papaver nudicaule TaxID=74823 RepID=A0AA41SAY4_PAPNU|nr:hypothetical protein [Papaver nudicaule]
MSVEEEQECVVDGEDEGPFFDLEFAVPHEEEKDECEDGDSETSDDDDDDDDGFDFTVSPDSNVGNQIDSSSLSPNNLTFSVPPLLLQSSPCSSTSSASSSVENSSTNPKVQFPVSLIKTATKIRVFMLGFKNSNNNSANKPKSEDQNREKQSTSIKTEQKQSNNNKKFVTVKFKVEEILPVISFFTKDSSSNHKLISSQEETEEEDEEKKLITKDVLQKYLKMIKPLYVRVSKRYNNNGGAFSPSRSMNSPSVIPSSSPLKVETEESSKNLRKQGVGNLPNGLRIVRKHLGKSRSASSVNPVTATTTNSASGIQAKRRDDSLLQQQDGIQSAILHCKRSFNASRDTDSCARSSTSEESPHEITIDSTRNSVDEVKK